MDVPSILELLKLVIEIRMCRPAWPLGIRPPPQNQTYSASLLSFYLLLSLSSLVSAPSMSSVRVVGIGYLGIFQVVPPLNLCLAFSPETGPLQLSS